MTTEFLEIPYLDQNIAQPEIPENEAKDIIDASISGIAYIDMVIDTTYELKETNQDDTITYPHEWQYAIIVLNSIAHTTSVNLVIPELKVTKYIIHNKTPVTITVTQYGTNEVSVPANTIYTVYCDGTDVWRTT